MRIHIVNYEIGMPPGILTKYADSMARELLALGHDVTVSVQPRSDVQVNHHINYIAYRGHPGLNTLMVTHLSGDAHLGSAEKLAILEKGLLTAHGICFSDDLASRLHDRYGMLSQLLHVVLPAHDDLPPKRKVVAIVSNTNPDGRKREEWVLHLVKRLDRRHWRFEIMGRGWERIANEMDECVPTFYENQFNADGYPQLLKRADFLLYPGGEDEGAMSVLDAAHVGLRTIAPNVGFHEKLRVTHAFCNLDELVEIFKKLERSPVADWTWRRYAEEHLKIWQEMLTRPTP